MGDGGIVGETVKAVKELAAPAYDDALKPAAKEFGQALQPAGRDLGEALSTVAKAVNAAFSPLRGMLWAWEQVRDFVVSGITERFAGKEDQLITPSPVVAIPALEAIRITGSEPTLRDMYLNLLAGAMDKDKAKNAHPAFVEMIKQLAPDEARILSFVSAGGRNGVSASCQVNTFARAAEDVIARPAKCEHPEMILSYLDNLERLRLLLVLGIPKNGPVVGTWTKQGLAATFGVRLTDFGNQFRGACMPETNQQTGS